MSKRFMAGHDPVSLPVFKNATGGWVYHEGGSLYQTSDDSVNLLASVLSATGFSVLKSECRAVVVVFHRCVIHLVVLQISSVVTTTVTYLLVSLVALLGALVARLQTSQRSMLGLRGRWNRPCGMVNHKYVHV